MRFSQGKVGIVSGPPTLKSTQSTGPDTVLHPKSWLALGRHVLTAPEPRETPHQIARKQKMLAAEEERKKRVPPTESEKVKEEKDQGTLTRAQYMLDEELDDVKHMNQMLLYSKCVTIRDAQIEEKKHIAQEAEEEDRKLDLMMELERIKAIEAYEEREQRRLEVRRACVN